MQQLYKAFVENGCSLAEINPLVVTPQGEVIAVDAKMVIDDNELERRQDLEELRDESSRSPSEVDARKANLTFIKLDGNVGCVVNGAGLAMATMDLVKYYGGEPANFLDIGGSSNPEKVVNALRIITADRTSRRSCSTSSAASRAPTTWPTDRDRDEAEPAQGADRDPPHGHERGDRVKILEENGFTA
jgi:succinyl-CoA synthetase beta subunit